MISQLVIFFIIYHTFVYIFRYVNLQLEPGQPHPAAVIATQESWPVLQRICSTYTADSRYVL